MVELKDKKTTYSINSVCSITWTESTDHKDRIRRDRTFQNEKELLDGEFCLKFDLEDQNIKLGSDEGTCLIVIVLNGVEKESRYDWWSHLYQYKTFVVGKSDETGEYICKIEKSKWGVTFLSPFLPKETLTIVVTIERSSSYFFPRIIYRQLLLLFSLDSWLLLLKLLIRDWYT